jgi:hypothetical protein
MTALPLQQRKRLRGKVVVMGFLERQTPDAHSNVTRFHPSSPTSSETLHAKVREDVEGGSAVSTDAWRPYLGLDADYLHGVIDHGVAYVSGQIHTNGLENFRSPAL